MEQTPGSVQHSEHGWAEKSCQRKKEEDDPYQGTDSRVYGDAKRVGGSYRKEETKEQTVEKKGLPPGAPSEEGSKRECESTHPAENQRVIEKVWKKNHSEYSGEQD